MPKQKPHKGLLKRVRVTAKGKVKFKSAYSGHLRSHKTGTRIRDLRKRKVAKSGDVVRFEKMLQRQLKGSDQGPSTTPRKSEQAAKA